MLIRIQISEKVATKAQIKVLCDDATEDFQIAYSKLSGVYCPGGQFREINLKCLNKELKNGDWTLEQINLIEQYNQTTINAQNNCYCLAGVINAWAEGFNTTNATTPDCEVRQKNKFQKSKAGHCIQMHQNDNY